MASLLDNGRSVRSEQVYHVIPATSLNNRFSGIKIPQNPGLAENNWNSGHQDSFCSESVGLKGPTGKTLKIIRQHNPYGFVPIMACNEKSQMIGISFFDRFRLVIFDEDCNIISATATGRKQEGTFGGGYFYLNNEDNSVVVGDGKVKCFPTADVKKTDSVYSLDPIWESKDIVRMVTGNKTGNQLYSSLPVWDSSGENKNLYWCLLSGSYDVTTGVLSSNAYIAVVEIVPSPSHRNGCTTELLGKLDLTNQWNNNTFAVDDKGAYFVTNGLDEDGKCNEGYLWAVEYTNDKVTQRWKSAYQNSGYLKPGQKNIGSGTTPTLFDDGQLVAITDNNYPKMNVVVYTTDDGSKLLEVPVFPKMRGCDEASLMGVKNYIVVENNFGHTIDIPWSQYVTNEPGMAMIEILRKGTKATYDIIWEDNTNRFFAMNMLARESGVIFAHTGDWSGDDSATDGAMYYIHAIDSWDGRVIWRIPVGRGHAFCHEYGGIYFNRKGDRIYMGTESYLICIQNNPTVFGLE